MVTTDNPLDTRRVPSDVGVHLRTVHFTLVVACVGVWLAATLDAARDLDRASADLRLIQRAVSEIDATWLSDSVAARVEQPKENYGETYVTTIDYFETATRTTITVPQNIWSIHSIGISHYLAADGDANNVLRAVHHQNGGLTYAVRRPQTLAEFAALWNALPIIRQAHVVEHWSEPEVAVIDTNAVTPGIYSDTGERYPSATPLILTEPTTQDEIIPAELELADGDDEFRLRVRATMVYDTTDVYDQKRARVDLLIPVVCLTRDLSLQKELAQLVDPHTVVGTFNDVFPELSRITTNYRRLEMGNIQRLLEDERRRISTPLELLGTKVPVTTFHQLGAMILVALQLYLLLHLRNLRRHARPDDPVFSVAWIGFYTDWASRGLTAISAAAPVPLYAYLLSQAQLMAADVNVRAVAVLATGFGILLSILSLRELHLVQTLIQRRQ